MPRIFIVLLSSFLFVKASVAQITYTWVGGANGDYQLTTNWTPVRTTVATSDILAFNADTTIIVANVPSQTIGAVRVLSGTYSVTFTTNNPINILSLSAATPLIFNTPGSILAGDLLTISLSNTAAFTISTGTFGIAASTGGKISINSDVNLAGGKLDLDVVGTGGTTINSGGSITYSSGIFNCANAAAINWNSGSNYYHAVSGAVASAIPAAVWAGGSTCNITGMNGGSAVISGFTGVTFANLNWNCPSQTGNVDLDFSGIPVNINGTLTITNTGSFAVRFSSTGASTVNAGAYSQTGGKLVLQSSSGSTVLSVKGTFSHTTGGIIDFVGSGGSGTAMLTLQGSVNKAPGTSWISSTSSTSAVMAVQFSGASSQSVTIGGGWVISTGRCNIINSNTDPVGVSVTGTLKVINANSVLPASCTNSGNFTGTGVINYSGTLAGANNYTLIYNGSAPQTASGVEFPAVNGPYNLSASSSVGISFPATFSRSVPGTFSMISGGIGIGNGNTLSLTNTSLATQLVYTAGFITSGTLSRTFPASGLPTDASTSNSRFPFGTGNNDRSINIFFSTTNLSGGTGGDIAISHNAVANATALTPFNDNGSLLDKRTNTNWIINTGTFNLGSGGTTISLTAQANNIGSVDNISSLRLTDAVAGFGNLIATTGSNDAPLVGKSNLTVADINVKTFYVGSDALNALQIVTFTWTGAANTSWTNAANWTGGVGYPSSPTEIAIINTSGGNMPVIGTGSAINVYQLTVGAAASLSMTGTASISVYDLVSVTGAVNFTGSSTFNYASSVASQNIPDLPYVNLGVSGSAPKILPATTTVTGDFTISGATPAFGTGTFIYAAGTAAIQRIAATSYYNLTFDGSRGGKQIRLGNGVSNNIIKVNGVFTMNATNYVANYDPYNTFDFASSATQTIPGFTYGSITNSGGGARIYDNQGSADPNHVINCKSLAGSAGFNNTAGSKIRFNRTSATGSVFSGFQFYDLEITGDLGGTNLSIGTSQTISVAGTFTLSATNFKQPATTHRFNFNGTGAQTIPAFKTNTSTNTPAWRFSNITVTNGNRIITLGGGGTDTINIAGTLTVPSAASFSAAGTGFVVAGSTVNYINGSGSVPALTPTVAGGNNYNNVSISGGTRFLDSNLLVGGNVSLMDSDTSSTTLNIGDFSNNRTLTILGNLSLSGVSASATAPNSIVDFNAGTKNVLIKLAGNLSVTGKSQLTTTNGSTVNGTLLFNGSNQQYNNTASYKNGFVNFAVGDGTTATTLTLNNNLELIRSATAPYSAVMTVANNAILNAGTKNITVGTDDNNNSGNNATFNLNAGATLVTANTGANPNSAIEGAATNGTKGTILSGTKITKNYNTAASYVLNGATFNPFPDAITAMANLTIGADVTLNRNIDVNSTLDLASFILTQNKNDLEFSGLTSTSGSINADKMSILSINGTIGTVGTLRFAPGGNTTGQFTINRPVTVTLGSDLTVDKSPKTGNFITGTPMSVLDINGNTLTINGTVSGTGFLAGSGTSNLVLGGAAGTINFVTGKQILKNLTLVNSAAAALGTTLDITAGTGAGTEGTVSVTGSAILTTGGNLTLKSNANGTARVASGAISGGYINGDVTVERYLSSNRSWRFLAAPTYGQTIHQAWQENQAAGVNGLPGLGTNITSNRASWAADGFDFQTPGNSLLIYNSATNAWDGAPNTSAQISAAGANKSYMLFLRGDRSVTPAVGAPSTAALVRTKGSLFQGDLSALPVTAGQYAAVGNNYASAIDFTLLTKLNIDNSFTVWDPYIPGAKNLGAWVTFSAATGWLPSIPGGSYLNVANTRIESGQAFMVHNSSAGAGTLTLTESSKLSGSKLVSRPSGNGVKQMLITNLYNTNGGVANIADGNIVVFSDEYSNVIDGWDAVKINNFGDNFGLSRNNQALVVDARQPIAETDTVFFNMKKIKQQPYRLEFIAKDFDASLMGFLEDTYLHSTILVNMAGTTNYDFSVTSDAASAAANRFRIVFKSSAPLPVTFSNIAATEKTNGIAVEWKVENEINIASYDVERSFDGRNFTKMNNMPATGQNTGGAASYNWLDIKAMAGDNFYRVRSISKDGKTAYSRIVKVTLEKGKAGFTVYPNPVADGMIGLQMKNIPAGIYTVRILNSDGQLISKEIISHTGGNGTQTITSAKQLVSGSYQVEITGEDKTVNVLRLLVL